MKISTVVASVCFSGLFLHVSCKQGQNTEEANLTKVNYEVSKKTGSSKSAAEIKKEEELAKIKKEEAEKLKSAKSKATIAQWNFDLKSNPGFAMAAHEFKKASELVPLSYQYEKVNFAYKSAEAYFYAFDYEKAVQELGVAKAICNNPDAKIETGRSLDLIGLKSSIDVLMENAITQKGTNQAKMNEARALVESAEKIINNGEAAQKYETASNKMPLYFQYEKASYAYKAANLYFKAHNFEKSVSVTKRAQAIALDERAKLEKNHSYEDLDLLKAEMSSFLVAAEGRLAKEKK